MTDPTMTMNQLLSMHQNSLQQQPMQQQSEKTPLDDIMQQMLQQMPYITGGMPMLPMCPKPGVSSGSDSPRNDSPSFYNDQPNDTPTTKENNRMYRTEPWTECYTTRKIEEFDALIYSVYVIQKDDVKGDGYDHYDCINRLQSKCRYRVRSKAEAGFIIVEEKGAHNHAMEPVGSAGSHAGLPKTLREIVDISFREDWNHTQRQTKLEEEVKRLGLPHNPRLNRQVDNRIAYLRRVKNLSEMKKLQDQLPMDGSTDPVKQPGDDVIKFMQQLAPEMPAPSETLLGDVINDPNMLLQLMMAGQQPMMIDQMANGHIAQALAAQPMNGMNQMTAMINMNQQINMPMSMNQQMEQPMAMPINDEVTEDEKAAQAQMEESNCSTPEARLEIQE